MIVGQEEPAPLSCPRCGGKMYRPVGSSFYWHADNNHRICEITNIPETALPGIAGTTRTPQPPAGPTSKKPA